MSSYGKAKQKYEVISGGGGGGNTYDPSSDRVGMCCAHGCPNRWTVNKGDGKCCSAHAWADRHRWPEITQQQQWDETERSRMSGYDKTPPFSEPLSLSDKKAILLRMRQVMAQMVNNPDPKFWAKQLRDREQRGNQLSIVQRAAWREALHHREDERA